MQQLDTKSTLSKQDQQLSTQYLLRNIYKQMPLDMIQITPTALNTKRVQKVNDKDASDKDQR